MINEADRKKPVAFSASVNDQKLVAKAAAIMDRSKSSTIMILIKRFLQEVKGVKP